MKQTDVPVYRNKDKKLHNKKHFIKTQSEIDVRK